MRESDNEKLRGRAAENHRTRRQIRAVEWFFIVLFAAMGVYICVYSAQNRREFFDNDYNGREEKMLAHNTRGRIYSADGKVLAENITNADGTQTRTYPYHNLFAHVVGYTDKGGSGIELAENYNLVHSDLTLAEKAALDNQGLKYAGNDVYSTLDTRLQQAASDALGSYAGAIIASDPKTGAVLAMVSKPDFDPETILTDWDTYLAQDNTTGTLLNRVTQGQYPPGSTFKIMDVIEYLKEHPDDWQNYSFTCTGSFTSGQDMIHDFHWEQHGEEDLTKSFAESCNSSFANLSLQLDRKSFTGTLQNQLLFNSALPVGFPFAESKFVLDDTTDTKEVMQLAIGQGQTAMSPLHLNLITNAIANDGVLMKPYLVDSCKTATGTVLSQNKPSQAAGLMDAQTAATMREMMQAVVEEGTASKLKGTLYTAAGKTGSAEFNASDSSQSHSWFTGFAPVDDPQITVTVIAEDAGVGGEVAVPAAKAVFDAYFAANGM